MEPGSADTGDGFSLVMGGPFHAMLRGFRLTGANQLPSWGAARCLALLAWLPPALFVVYQSLTDASQNHLAFHRKLAG